MLRNLLTSRTALKTSFFAFVLAASFGSLSADAANKAAAAKKPAASKPAAVEKSKEPPPPDYFPLRVNDWWKYQSTTGEGKQSNFMMKVISAEKQPDEHTIFLVDTTMPAGKTIHDWYSKRNDRVIRHKEQFGDDANFLVEYDPWYIYLHNPLVNADTWQWSGKGLMKVDIQETSDVTGPEDIYVPAGKFSTMKIVTKVVQGGSPVTKTYWFANWVGLIKSATQSGPVASVTELLDYSFKNPEKKP